MRLARWAIVALTSSVAGVLAPASCSETAPGVEQERDAGLDAHRRRDSSGGGVDDDAGEAPLDAGPYPEDAGIFVGKWHALPGVPSFCDVRVSDEPEKLASKWLPCPSGRAGCRRLDTSWTKHPPGAPGRLVDVSKGPEPTRLVGGKAYFMIGRFWHSEQWLPSNTPIGYMYVLEPLDEAPVLAIASGPIALIDNAPRYCSGEVGFGDYGVSYDVGTRDPRQPAKQDNGADTFLLGWAPWENLTSFTTKTVNVMDFGLASKIGYFLNPALGEKSIWFTTRAPRSVGLFELEPRSARLLKVNLPSETPTPASGGAFVFDTKDFAITFARDVIHLDVRGVKAIAPNDVWRCCEAFTASACGEWGTPRPIVGTFGVTSCRPCTEVGREGRRI